MFNKIDKIQIAVAVFQQKIDAGQILIPQSLPDVTEDDVVIFPDAIIMNKKIVPIIYDKTNNIISLDKIRSGT